MMRRLGLATLLISCLPAQDMSLPPEALVSAPDADDARPAELVRTSDVDPNRGPVTIWSVERGPEPAALYIIGHAEERCCRAISQMMAHLRNRPELGDAWFTYGFGAFQAGGGKRPGGGAVLQEAVEHVRDLIAPGNVCAGEAILKQTATDPTDTGARLLEAGKQALARAKQEQRPVVAYFKGGAEPTLAPLFGPGRDGALGPLSYRLPRNAVQIPPVMLAALSLGDSLEDVIDLKEVQRNLEIALHAVQTREPLTVLPTVGRPADDRHTAFGARLREKIGEDMARLRAIEDERQRFCIVAGEVAALDPGARPWKTMMCETLRDEVASLTAGLAASLREIDAEGKGSTAFEWKFFRQLPPDPSIQDTYARLVDRLDEAALQKRYADSERMLRTIYARSRGRRFDPADAAAIIIDAAMRGWPATFIDEDSEHEFDAWNARNQGPLWRMTFTALQRQSVRWASEEPNPLQTSTLLFRVTDTGEAFKIEPLHVLAGDYYMIADPDSSTVRFEATTTEQNLR